jgi:peptide/nickel transport system substrate-binding protein
VERGGRPVFHISFTGGAILNPVVTAPFRGLGAAGWFGWYGNPKLEELTQDWLDAEDADERLKIAMAIQLENYAQVPTVNLGQFQNSPRVSQEPDREAGSNRTVVLERQAGVDSS